jgi:hypothetical protein
MPSFHLLPTVGLEGTLKITIGALAIVAALALAFESRGLGRVAIAIGSCIALTLVVLSHPQNSEAGAIHR